MRDLFESISALIKAMIEVVVMLLILYVILKAAGPVLHFINHWIH